VPSARASFTSSARVARSVPTVTAPADG
jgi:hypothetical protein